MGLGYFFGVNHSVSGNDWNDANAPWNQRARVFHTCPECDGDGGIYYNNDGEELSKVDYDRLSDEDKALWNFDKCMRCDGTGEIEVAPEDYDYDYD